MILAAINPYSTRFKTFEEQSTVRLLNSANLSRIDRIIIFVATAIIGILSFNIFTESYRSLLVKRFKIIHQLKNHEISAFQIKKIDKTDKIDKIDKTDNTDELERKFWTYITNNSFLHNRFQLIITNGKDSKKQAAHIVAIYSNMIAQESNVLLDGDKSLLITLIAKQIDNHRQRFKVTLARKSFALKDEAILHVHPTLGDGSCAIHALIGQDTGKDFRVENIAKVRQDFCDDLKKRYVQKQPLPKYVKLTLNAYASEFNLEVDGQFFVPETFRNLAQAAYERMVDDIENLTNAEVDERRLAFIQDPEVIHAYIEHFKAVSTFLDQYEIEMFAEYLNKRLFLFQPGWGNDHHIVSCSRMDEILDPNFKPQENDVCVWFSGAHYERANLERLFNSVVVNPNGLKNF